MIGTINVQGLREQTLDDLINLVEQVENQLRRLANQKSIPTWQNFCLPLERLEDKTTKAFHPLQHLNNVVPGKYFSEEGFEKVAASIAAFFTSLKQNPNQRAGINR